MRDGDISNKPAGSIAYNCAAFFDITGPNLFSRAKMRANKFAENAMATIIRTSVNRVLLVEKAEWWRSVEDWRDKLTNPDLEPTYMVPIFYGDHYGTLRAQYSDIYAALWMGDRAPGYEEVIAYPQADPATLGLGWSIMIDKAREMEG